MNSQAMAIKYRLNYDKILEALVWIANKRPDGIDFFHVCKTLYFADKIHLNKYARPVLGDVYISMNDGPVPSKAYDMLKRSHPYLDGHTLQKISDALIVDSSGKYPKLRPKREANEVVFSATDLEALTEAVARYADMPFDELWNLVHEEQAWRRTVDHRGLNAEIEFEAMVDPDAPDRDQILKEIHEVAAHLVM